MERKEKCSGKPAGREGESGVFRPAPDGCAAEGGNQKHIRPMNDEVEQVKAWRAETRDPVERVGQFEQRP